MNRYTNIKIGSRFDGKRIYKSNYYPTIQVDESDIYITTGPNSYMDVLAKRYYNDQSLWWIISKANNIKGGSISVLPGIQLRIPMNLTVILQKYTDLNS